MFKTTKTLKILGASFLSLGAISICAAAVTHSIRIDNEEVQAAAVNYDTANSYHNSGDAWGLFQTLQTLSYSTPTNDYDDLWEIYKTVFKKSDGTIFDYYSNTSSFKPGRVTDGGNQCGSYSNEGDCYNREHSIPKSWWGSSETKQGCDPYIVIPTDGKVNGMRNNYPLGEVGSATYTSNNNFSKLGSSKTSITNYSDKVFEPNDTVKGDFARIHFYAAVRYSKNTSNYVSFPSYNWNQQNFGAVLFSGIEPTQNNSSDSSKRFCLTNYAIKLFTKWNELDPPDDWERSVNNKLHNLSSVGNINPFIDHPEYVNTLWGGVTGATTYTGGGTPSEKTLSSISLSGQTTQFTVGDTFSFGGTVTAHFSDSSSSNVTSSTTFSGYNMAVADTYEVTASYTYSGTTKTAKYNITVSESSGGGGGDQESEYHITFNTAASDGSSEITTANLINYSNDNTLVSEFTASSKCFPGTSGIKLGGGSATGSFTASVVSAAQSNVASITVESAKYGSDTGTLTLKVNGLNAKTEIKPGQTTTYTLSEPGTVTSFGLVTSSKRAYVSSVTFNIDTSGSVDPDPEPPTLDGIAIKTAPTKTTYTAGEYFDPTGLVISTDYSDDSNPDVSYAGNEGDFTFTPSLTTALTTSDKSVTISYGGQPCEQAITVNAAPTPEPTTTTDFNLTGNFIKVTNSTNLTSGDYLIVCENQNVAFNGNLSTLDGTSNTVSVSPSSGVITYNASLLNAVFTYDSTTNTLKSHSGYYIGLDSDTNYLSQSTTTLFANTITFDSGNAEIVASGGAHLRYNSQSGQTRFRYYKTSSYSSQKTIQLYKKTTNWAQYLLNTVVCDNGVTPPSSTEWKKTQTAYNSLETADKNTVLAATANEGGTTLQKAIARYLAVVNRYTNRTDYPDYLNKASQSNRYGMPLVQNFSTTSLLVGFGIASSFLGFMFLGLWLKKNEN